MGNEAARQQLGDVLVLMQKQLTDIAALQEKQAALTASAVVADGAVEVMVDARGQLVKAVIDKSFLDGHDFDELGECIAEAVRAAADDAGRRVGEMWAPINERHQSFPSFSDIVEGAPDLRDLMPPGWDALTAFTANEAPEEDVAGRSVGDVDGDGDGANLFKVRR